MNKVEIGARIREARKQKGMTQERLAEKVGIGPTYLSDLERGVKFPGFSTFVAIVEALDTSADSLLRGEVSAGKQHIYDELTKKLDHLTPKQRQCVADIIDAYLQTI